MVRLILAVSVSLLLAVTASARADEPVSEYWKAIYLQNTRAGYGRVTTKCVDRNGVKFLVTDVEDVLVMKRFNDSFTSRSLVHSEETPEGDLVSFHSEIQNPPAATTRSRGRVAGDKLLLEREIDGQVIKTEIAWDRSIKSPTAVDRLLGDKPLKAGEKRVVKIFDPGFHEVMTITQQAEAKQAEVKLLGKQSKSLLHVKSQYGTVLTMDLDMDPAGVIWKESTPLMGMAIYRVPRDEALKSISAADLDLGTATLVKVAPLRNANATRRVVYRLSLANGDPVGVVSTGPGQQVKRVDEHTADVTITAFVPPRAPRAAEKMEAFLKPNPYLQSDNELVKKHAAEAGGDERDPWKTAVKLEHWVSANLKKKNFSTLLASAGEVARTLSGDCTEHAVLLAAMARVRGIPSRVAVGLVYAPEASAFAGHMWTEVYVNGVWTPLDATIGQGWIAAEHIKFGHTSFQDEKSTLTDLMPLLTVLGSLKIKVISAE